MLVRNRRKEAGQTMRRKCVNEQKKKKALRHTHKQTKKKPMFTLKSSKTSLTSPIGNTVYSKFALHSYGKKVS